MSRYDPRAIAVAMLLSLALDVVGGVLLVMLFGADVRADMTPEEAQAAIEAVLQHNGFLLASLLYGTGTTVFAGHVAARLARGYPYFNALAVGVIGIVLTLWLSGSPGWVDALAVVITVPAALWGAHLWVRSGRR